METEPMRMTMIERGAGLSTDEREAIALHASIRRRQTALQKDFLAMEQAGGGAEDPHSEKARHDRDRVLRIASGDTGAVPACGEREDAVRMAEQMMTQGREMEPHNPRGAAYKFAYAAEIASQLGEDASSALSSARRCLDTTAGRATTAPADYLPDALMIRVEKRLAAERPIPESETVARAILGGKAEPFKDYALVLPEADRDRFLSFFSEKKTKGLSRAEVSGILDRLAAEVLPKGEHILERSGAAAREAIAEPTAAETRRMVAMLARTIREAGGDAAPRLLAELGGETLKRVKGDKEATAARLQSGAKVARELFALDKKTGGMLMMKLLGRKDIGNGIWNEFVSALVSSGELSEKILHFLPAHTGVFRKLFAEYPNQVNTVADTLFLIPEYDPTRQKQELFSALSDLETITPILFDRYRHADAAGKKDIARRVRELKPKFFRNDPIRNALQNQDRDILAEMVYTAYQPVGMSFREVTTFLDRLEDHTEDVSAYEFPRDGYEVRFGGARMFRLKEGTNVDWRSATSYRDWLLPKREDRVSGESGDTKDTYSARMEKILVTLAKGGTGFPSDQMCDLLSLLADDDMVRQFRERHGSVNEENGYRYFSEVKEIFGVYFSDHYHERLANFLSANPNIAERVLKMLGKPERQDDLRRKLSADGAAVNWDLSRGHAAVAEVLAKIIETKVLKSAKEAIGRDVNKFVAAGDGGSGGRVGATRAYISKNVGSFFAKASAGICTADDIELFNREDHFHINAVEDEAHVRGNTQAYVIEEPDGRQSLVLRGFNPTTDFLERVDAGAFAEQMISVGKQFVTDNGFAHLYITEDLGMWHALSNREAVQKYLVATYKKKKRERARPLVITGSGDAVQYLYEIV